MVKKIPQTSKLVIKPSMRLFHYSDDKLATLYASWFMVRKNICSQNISDQIMLFLSMMLGTNQFLRNFVVYIMVVVARYSLSHALEYGTQALLTE